MNLRLPYWQRTLVMVVCLCGLVWALSMDEDPTTCGAALLFASLGALVVLLLLRHIDRLANCVAETREELQALKGPRAGTASESPVEEGESR